MCLSVVKYLLTKFSVLQCNESDENIVSEIPGTTNAYIPLGNIRQFRCASRNRATLDWSITIRSHEVHESNSEFLISNGVTWEPNPSTGSRNITITLNATLENRVAGMKCTITLTGQEIQQCFIFINIHIYGE